MRPRTDRTRRAGFTLIEMACAALLMGLLMTLIAGSWAAFGVPAAEVQRRGRVAREASLAAAALAADLGGVLPEAATMAGHRDLGRLVGWEADGTDRLRLCFDGGPTPDGLPSWSAPDVVIAYSVDDRALIRFNEENGTRSVAAGEVDSIEVVGVDASQFVLRLNFRCGTVERTYTFVGGMP